MRSSRQSVVSIQRNVGRCFSLHFFSATVWEPGFDYLWSLCYWASRIGVIKLFMTSLPSCFRALPRKMIFIAVCSTALFSFSGQGLRALSLIAGSLGLKLNGDEPLPLGGLGMIPVEMWCANCVHPRFVKIFGIRRHTFSPHFLARFPAKFSWMSDAKAQPKAARIDCCPQPQSSSHTRESKIMAETSKPKSAGGAGAFFAFCSARRPQLREEFKYVLKFRWRD